LGVWAARAGREANPVYYCADPDAHGHAFRYASPGTTPATSALAGASGQPDPGPPDASRRPVIEGNRAWAAAAEVRKRWLPAHLFARRTAPRRAALFAARQLLAMPGPLRAGLATAHGSQLFSCEEIDASDVTCPAELNIRRSGRIHVDASKVHCASELTICLAHGDLIVADTTFDAPAIIALPARNGTTTAAPSRGGRGDAVACFAVWLAAQPCEGVVLPHWAVDTCSHTTAEGVLHAILGHRERRPPAERGYWRAAGRERCCTDACPSQRFANRMRLIMSR
jgi:hypothetical protein